jgi:hypothetical protein
MLGQTAQIFAEADLAYHRERIMAQFPARTQRRQLRWPRPFSGPRHPHLPRRPMPAPHHSAAH